MSIPFKIIYNGTENPFKNANTTFITNAIKKNIADNTLRFVVILLPLLFTPIAITKGIPIKKKLPNAIMLLSVLLLMEYKP